MDNEIKSVQMVQVAIASLGGDLEVKSIEATTLLQNLVEFEGKKYIKYALENTGTAGTNVMTINLLVETVWVDVPKSEAPIEEPSL